MKIITEDQFLLLKNDSFKRGHVLFTSFISKRGKALHLNLHLDRLIKGAHFLFPEMGWPEKREALKSFLLQQIDQREQYFRVTLVDDFVLFEKKEFSASDETVKLTSALHARGETLLPPYVKLSQYTTIDLELQKARSLGFDDVVFFDQHGKLCEGSTSNIFVINSKGAVRTPRLSSVVLDGVLRSQLLNYFRLGHMNVREADLYEEDLMDASEVWLTNSVKGIRSVSLYKAVRYNKETSKLKEILDAFGRYGEMYE